MPYYMKTEGIDELGKTLDTLGNQAHGIAAQSLYEGTGEMIDTIWKKIDDIKTAPFKWAKAGETRLPSPEEKAILQEPGAIGIAKFEKDGNGAQTSVGMDATGYADVSWNHMQSSARTNYKIIGGKHVGSKKAKLLGIGRGRQNRKPIGAIANAINSGTSFMNKQPFFRKGVKDGTPKAETAIIDAAEARINQIIESNGEESA